ncbi:MAG: hypothetical protein M1825_002087 [Sarcosagium campestre]|nr:MAG: hypothetical protein M1825_002087 [Sarcosagium campestre]
MASLPEELKGKYPAKSHAKRVVEYLKSKSQDVKGIIYLEGQKTKMIEDNDGTAPFRQRRYFYYLTGCPLPDCSFIYDIENAKSTLFIPPIDADDVIWSGLPLSPAEASNIYDVDEVLTTTELESAFARLPHDVKQVTAWVIKDQISIKPDFTSTDDSLVKQAIERCRIVKDSYEIALTRHANAVSTLAHTASLRAAKRAKNEREIEAIFLQQSIAHGCREQAYHSIVASGVNAATLHYQKNDEPTAGRLNLLLDAGAEFRCYASDITRTFPLSGSFTAESRAIYDIVLRMQKECTHRIRAGVDWEEVHSLAHRVAIDGMLDLGILKGNHDEIFAARTSCAFFPHGLGHYLGLDTHDTGGDPNYADTDPMFRYLRVRAKLPAGSIVTVEPGIYFCRFIIDPYLKDPKHAAFIDKTVLDRYWTVGGVRIEDNILVTDDGFENLTTAIKEVDEMEKIINGEAQS